jgi:hypothetical protein
VADEDHRDAMVAEEADQIQHLRDLAHGDGRVGSSASTIFRSDNRVR